MEFAPSASTLSTTAECTVAAAFLRTRICWARTDSRTDVCPSEITPEFLNAFQKGEVTRLAVVERLERPPGRLAAGQLPGQPVKELMKATDPNRQYAAASNH